MAASTNAQWVWLVPYVAINTHPPRTICAFAKGQTEMNAVTTKAKNITAKADKPAARLPAAAITEAATLTKEVAGLRDAELGSERKRALLYRAFSKYVLKYGLEAINEHAKKEGYDGKQSRLTYQLAAQFLTGINIFEVKGDDRAERQTLVRPFALVLDALLRRADEHSSLEESQWLDWYRANRQQKGLLTWLKERAGSSAKTSDAQPAPETLIDEAFGSLAAVPLVGDLHLPDLIPGRPMLVMVRQDETGIRVVPLPKAGSTALASVAGYRSTGLENAPVDLRFWHQLMSVGTAIIPDTVSDEPVSALEPDDEANASTPMLPAYATYLWVDGKFSVAGARSQDTRIVEVFPREGVKIGIKDETARFIDKRTRNTMTDRLLQPSVCAGYGGDKGVKVIADDRTLRVKFKHTDKRLNGQLSFPLLSEFRTNWTSRVSPEFNPAADAIMDEAAIAEFRSTFLNMLASKSKADVQVLVTISDSQIAFKRAGAKSIDFPAEASGSANVRVMQSDLLAIIPALLGLERVGGLAWELDTEGLLMIKVWTKEATICAYMQTLEEGRDTRSRKLLEKVRAARPSENGTNALRA
jgi:hypothetical protein